MRQKKQITNRTFVLTALIGSLIVVSMVTANTVWSSRQTVVATDEAVSAVSSFYLEAMADRRAKTITNIIESNFEEMEKAVAFIEDEKIDSQDDLRNAIGKVKSLLGLDGFGLADEDDVVYTQYTTYTGGSRHQFLSAENLSDRFISTVSLYGSSKQLCLAIPTPDLSIAGKHFKACFVQFDIKDIVDLLAFDDEDRTRFALYSKNGVNLSDTDLGPIIAKDNLLDALQSILPNNVWEQNVENFTNVKAGGISFTSGENTETLCYVPIEEMGWEIAVLIRESLIQDQIRDISEKTLEASRNQIIFTLVSVLLFATVLLFQTREITKKRLETEKEAARTFHNLANTDSLTGVRNKHAYTENEAVINEKIRTGECQDLAVVVADINGLKHVNDTQGHAAGDQLIKDACSLICEHFAHGAVFRIGGDEFAVILQGKGFDTMLEVIDGLNRTVEANINEGAVVVSVGYSILNQNDKQLREVFERADQMMYVRKKELKSMGAPNSRDV